MQDRFDDGVAFVDLAPLRSSDEVLPAIADAVDAHATGTADVTSAIVERLHGQRTLVVLDNVEHLVGSCDLLVELLDRAPAVRLLVTSRERLNLREEWVFDLEELPYADDGAEAPRSAAAPRPPLSSPPTVPTSRSR